MGEIEDVVGVAALRQGSASPSSAVGFKFRKKNSPGLGEFFTPYPQILGTQRYSEYMAGGQLIAFGYAVSDSPDEAADLWLINTHAAARMKKAPSTIVKKSRELTSVLESFSPLEGMEGLIQTVDNRNCNILSSSCGPHQRIQPSSCHCHGEHPGYAGRGEDRICW